MKGLGAMVLTNLEQQIFAGMAEGRDDRDLAYELSTTVPKLRECWAEICAKLDALQPRTSEEFQILLDYVRIENRRLAGDVSASEARLYALMDTAPEAVFLIDGRSGKILKANNNAVLAFGYSLRELVGEVMEFLIPADQREVHRLFRDGFLRSVRKREIGYHPAIFALHKDGSLIPLDIALTASQTSDEVMVVCRVSSASDEASPTSAARTESGFKGRKSAEN